MIIDSKKLIKAMNEELVRREAELLQIEEGGMQKVTESARLKAFEEAVKFVVDYCHDIESRH